MDNLWIYQWLIYFVLIFSVTAYVVLDGFDIGVGCLHLFAKGDMERRLFLNAIGPVWDGNSVWIVVTGGVLLAGFPKVFSSLLSGLYTPFMLLIFCFMFRAAAIEFRGKRKEKFWRKTWDILYFLSTLVLAIDLGLIVGNLIKGLPINEKGEVVTDFLNLLHPYSLVVTALTISIFVMHGSLYLLMKTEHAAHEKVRRMTRYTIGAFIGFFVLTTLVTFIYQPHMIKPLLNHPILWILPILSLIALSFIPFCVKRKRDGYAFICSSLMIIFLFLLFIIGTYPNIVLSSIDPEQNSLTFYNSSATKTALLVMVIVAIAGIPLAALYAFYLYKVFRGKIEIDHMSY